MFESGVTAEELIEELKHTEVDIALEIPNATYVAWLNALHRLLYTEVIKEQNRVVFSVSGSDDRWMDLSSIDSVNGEKVPSFEDIHAVYADDVQLIHSTLASGRILRNTYFKEKGGLGFHTEREPRELSVVYFVVPEDIVVTGESIGTGNVRVPVEFLDLVKAKLRGEAYKLANEDSIAAKWLNDYNVLLDTFRSWIEEKSPSFGL